jgi:hypothetical protein
VESGAEEHIRLASPAKKRKTTFAEDREEAIDLAKQCEQPLGALFRQPAKVDVSMLTFEEHAAMATEQRRRAIKDPLATTKLARQPNKHTNTNTSNTDTSNPDTSNTNKEDHPPQTSNMDPFWQDPNATDVFAPLRMALQSDLQVFPGKLLCDVMY